MTSLSLGRPGLLVSVRSVAEAEVALAGGADLIDVKEPSRGSLGRADDETIAAVVQAVGGRKPVSAAMGELHGRVWDRFPRHPGLAFAKWGLAGCGDQPDHAWTRLAIEAMTELEHWSAGCKTVFAAYADFARANSPPPEVICQLARQWRLAAFLVDTFQKDGSTLVDWLPLPRIALLCRLCRAGGIAIALAGSLGAEQIAALLPLEPDWIAVRGAACRQGRQGEIDAGRVGQLVELLAK
jgi:hypothetical protein